MHNTESSCISLILQAKQQQYKNKQECRCCCWMEICTCNHQSSRKHLRKVPRASPSSFNDHDYSTSQFPPRCIQITITTLLGRTDHSPSTDLQLCSSSSRADVHLSTNSDDSTRQSVVLLAKNELFLRS